MPRSGLKPPPGTSRKRARSRNRWTCRSCWTRSGPRSPPSRRKDPPPLEPLGGRGPPRGPGDGFETVDRLRPVEDQQRLPDGFPPSQGPVGVAVPLAVRPHHLTRVGIVDVAETRQEMVLDLVIEPGTEQPADPARAEVRRCRRLPQEKVTPSRRGTHEERLRRKVRRRERREERVGEQD